MCGIAGFIGKKNKKIAVKMQRTLKRRGPNQKGIYESDFATLIHTRLAVVDIEHGRQPMTFEQFTVVYNGELYNTDDIKQELSAFGHKFNGTGDTEVVLHSFAQWGEECLQRFNGIFAFAIWDAVNNKLFLARDRIGVKPLFYFHDGMNFIFGSEIPTLLAHPNVPHIIDKTGIRDLILLGPGRMQGSGVIKNIYELKPAEFAFVTGNKIVRQSYWELKDINYTKTYDEAVQDVRAVVTDAVKRQLISDVPVGTFLSGGIDSSIISAIASSQIKNLQTFSVDYYDNQKYFIPNKFQPNDDQYYINLMNNHINANGSKTVIKTDELVKSLYKAADARGLPGMADVDGSLLLFCKDIKKQVTVALSGECADEIFGGYPWFYRKELQKQNGFPWAQNVAFRLSILKNKWTKNITLAKYYPDKSKNICTDCMKEMTKLNMDWFMQTLLDRKDRMSMYSGLEVRVPFCDYRLVELAYNLPDEYKFRNGTEKSILRDAFRGILPDEIADRKKSPYPKTHNPKYLARVKRELKRITEDRYEPIHKIVKKAALTALLKNTDNTVPFYGQLMTTPQTMAYLIQLNYWLKKFEIIIEM
jgi:asparagine synthase (glutamine-hydrolysing)